jgi:hypothetical protein
MIPEWDGGGDVFCSRLAESVSASYAELALADFDFLQ